MVKFPDRSLLSYKRSLSMNNRFAMVSGTRELNEFLDKPNVFRFFIKPISLGIGPVKVFLVNDKTTSECKFPNSVGIVPAMLFPERRRLLNELKRKVNPMLIYKTKAKL